jgi:hypothetical protein
MQIEVPILILELDSAIFTWCGIKMGPTHPANEGDG